MPGVTTDCRYSGRNTGIGDAGVEAIVSLKNLRELSLMDTKVGDKGLEAVAKSTLGQRDYSMRLWLNPERMAALNLTSTDVVKAIQAQNMQVAAGQIGQQPVPNGQEFQLTMSTLGRLQDIDPCRRGPSPSSGADTGAARRRRGGPSA